MFILLTNGSDQSVNGYPNNNNTCISAYIINTLIYEELFYNINYCISSTLAKIGKLVSYCITAAISKTELHAKNFNSKLCCYVIHTNQKL